MSAKKLTTTTHQIVVRSFRGARLVLCAVHPDRGFAWTTDRGNALKLLPADALKLARAAAIHWGADAVTLDIDGVAVQPKEARKAKAYPALTGAQIMALDMRLQVLRDSEDEDSVGDFAREHIEPYGYTAATWEAAVSEVQDCFSRETESNRNLPGEA